MLRKVANSEVVGRTELILRWQTKHEQQEGSPIHHTASAISLKSETDSRDESLEIAYIYDMINKVLPCAMLIAPPYLLDSEEYRCSGSFTSLNYHRCCVSFTTSTIVDLSFRS